MEIIVIDPVSYLMQDGRYMGIFGILLILLVAFLFSNNKRKINIRLVVTALVMQFCLAFLILKTTMGQNVFATIASGFEGLYGFATVGSEFVFGRLADASGPWGMVFAIKVLPTIIFFGALMAVLYHLGIVQIFVKGLAFLIRPLLGTSGAETLSVAANSMLGQTEAPLLIKNYLKNMTQSEMLVVMVGGMSHLSGSLLAVYGSMGVPIEHLLASTIMAIPGAIMISKILIPQTEVPETAAGSSMKSKPETSNILDAVATGTSDGLRLAINVGAMLIAFISLMAMINHILFATIGMSLDALFAEVFYLVAFMLGVPFKDSRIAGSLLGQKLVINEFVAYMSFMKADLADRSRVILTYALAGFSNFSCIGIQIGGLGALCPERRQMIIKLGLTALLGGTLTNFLNAAIAGLLV